MIPVVLIHGTLGSGKTTLVQRLIAIPEFNLAIVIENEFASSDIDSITIQDKQQSSKVISICGGCVCCSSFDQLTQVLTRIVKEDNNHPVILETTGVVDIANFFYALFLSRIFIEHFQITQSILVLDPLVTSPQEITTTRRLEVALSDLVIINKMDIAQPHIVDRLSHAIATIAPQSHVYQSVFSQLPENMSFLDSLSSIEKSFVENIGDITSRPKYHHNISYALYRPFKPLSVHTLLTILSNARLSENMKILRLKGYFFNQEGHWWHIEATNQHQEITSAHAQSEALLVFIGEHISPEVVNNLFINH